MMIPELPGVRAGKVERYEGDRLREIGLEPDPNPSAPVTLRVVGVSPDTITVQTMGEKIDDMPNNELRLCTHAGCDLFGRHYENCPVCLGFGVHGTVERPIPIRAAAASNPPADARACPYCNSTTAGAPR